MDWTEKTIGQIINDLGRDYADKTAIKYNDRDFHLTWKQLDELTDKIAKGFMALGVKKGDKVAIWATNVPEWHLTLFACSKIGGILVTVNTNYKVFEMDYLLRQSDTKLLVMSKGFKDSNYVSIINELLPGLKNSKDGTVKDRKFPELKNILYAGSSEDTPQGIRSFWDMIKLGESVSDEEFAKRQASFDCHDVTNMQYTSGTTGFPKGVMLTHYNIVNNGVGTGDAMNLTPSDIQLVCVPLFHCFGLVLATMSAITHATAMVPVEAYSPVPVMKAISEEGCTVLHGVPTMFIAILEHPEFSKYQPTMRKTLRTGIMAGSPCPIKVMQQCADELNMKDIIIVFGQTESSPGCTVTTTDDSLELRVSTVGRVYPGVEAKVVNPETGETLPPHTTGEFCARGYNIMKGYYKMPEATAQAIDKDGWLHTGDLATVDENGYYKIVGRIKDMVIRGGENIYPKEIEELLYTHPKVSDVQVVGVPSKRYGEEIMAVIILKDGEEATEEEIKDFVKSKMARHKTPAYVRFVKGFPTTASGKIQKYKLREEAIEMYGLGEAASVETA